MGAIGGRGRLSKVTVEQWFGALILAVLGVLVLDLVRRVVFGELPVDTLSVFLWRGLVDGLIIALAAVGLSMTYAILKFANFSQGDLVTTGAFAGWTGSYVVAGIGVADFGSRILLNADRGTSARELDMHLFGAPLAILVGLIVAALATILVALAFDRLVYKRMRTAGGIPLLIASIGVALVLRYMIVFFYGEHTRGVTRSSPTVDHSLVFWTDSLHVHQATLVVVGIGLMLALHLMLQHTKLGTAMRAMADNRDLALITGIPTERVILVTWILGAGLTGVAGYLIVLEQETLSFNTGWFLLLLIFSAVILGGIGSIYGAIAGGLIIGLATNVSLVWIPADLTEVAAFTLMILILIFRPAGLFGGVETA
ncbi:branched-chain amino acid ABC transporter permease [Natronobacterium texcoconense]|uniref:Amino acid/amide ABC transporter membrane protein 1, HAAT family n=1 Tax=Natronobacterium texcoconense TaxID=1095778 RepID=A0A1H1A1V3_NATTX|nr:branched-chain amino acid ABC transporter permease [Natronobacterium texcoconense]SDQ33684.1 amino acid/amide ABC transporter membrane protein 1, HAAT family [Natronobacterium texcoconense]